VRAGGWAAHDDHHVRDGHVTPSTDEQNFAHMRIDAAIPRADFIHSVAPDAVVV